MIGIIALAAMRFQAADSLFGTAHGLDHVSIYVHDLAQVRQDLGRKCGFWFRTWGKFPDGWRNGGIYFADHTYLEYLESYDHKQTDTTDEGKLLARGEGAESFGLETSDMASTLAKVKQGGWATETGVYPDEASLKTGKWGWKYGYFPKESPAGSPFFIEYNPTRMPEPVPMPNQISGVFAYWVAVKDLDAAAGQYRSAGFKVEDRADQGSPFDGSYRLVHLGSGWLGLVQPRASSALAKVLSRRGEQLTGAVLYTTNFALCRSLIENDYGSALREGQTPWGKSFELPEELTQGFSLWVIQER